MNWSTVGSMAACRRAQLEGIFLPVLDRISLLTFGSKSVLLREHLHSKAPSYILHSSKHCPNPHFQDQRQNAAPSSKNALYEDFLSVFPVCYKHCRRRHHCSIRSRNGCTHQPSCCPRRDHLCIDTPNPSSYSTGMCTSQSH